jgi:hypothetical protein
VRIDWVSDTPYRFFPASGDPEFGSVVSMSDLAMNKVSAILSRHLLRDAIDLRYLRERHLPLGAVIWGGVDRFPGFSPESTIAQMRRLMRYSPVDYRVVDSQEPISPETIVPKIRAMLDAAEAFVVRMPSDRVGTLFLKDGKPVQPDPERPGEYERRRATIGGGT